MVNVAPISVCLSGRALGSLPRPAVRPAGSAAPSSLPRFSAAPFSGCAATTGSCTSSTATPRWSGRLAGTAFGVGAAAFVTVAHLAGTSPGAPPARAARGPRPPSGDGAGAGGSRRRTSGRGSRRECADVSRPLPLGRDRPGGRRALRRGVEPPRWRWGRRHHRGDRSRLAHRDAQAAGRAAPRQRDRAGAAAGQSSTWWPPVRDAGLPVEYRVSGSRRCPPVRGLSRVVQEAMTNVLKHARGRRPRCGSWSSTGREGSWARSRRRRARRRPCSPRRLRLQGLRAVSARRLPRGSPPERSDVFVVRLACREGKWRTAPP
ncbi:hypothetical protein QJS66_12715 [Kocuria rhizophila]|nr:hypothetical protein QJS66_12715 [Kocuria rhizophila]